MQSPAQHPSWSSRWTFIMAATGSAVGLGNIWKFPYITGENGGGAFVLAYLLCMLIVGLPILMAEILMGRHARSNPISALRQLARESDASPLWGGIALIGLCASLLIIMFYSVIGGWIVDYFFASASGSLANNTAAQINDHFNKDLLSNPLRQLGFFSVFLASALTINALGVNQGIGKMMNVMMPLLFALLLSLLVLSSTQSSFQQGLDFMFTPDFSKLTPHAWLVALGHAFFSLSLGMCAILAYGAYMPNQVSIVKTAVTIGLLDAAVALISSMIIFPLIFAHDLDIAAGPSLMFISLPLAFSQLPWGAVIAAAFFFAVFIAAWSSAISLLEPSIAWLSERTPLSRLHAALLVGVLVWCGGAACIYVDGFFDHIDFFASNILLPLGGLLIAIFCGWIMKRKIAKTQLSDLSYHQFNLWYGTLRVVSPIAVLIVMAFSLGLLG